MYLSIYLSIRTTANIVIKLAVFSQARIMIHKKKIKEMVAEASKAARRGVKISFNLS